MKYKLVIYDVGGVLRDSTDAMYKGFKLGFESVGIDLDLDRNLIWKLRSFKSFHNSRDCIQALYAIIKYGQNLERLIKRENTEEDIEKIIRLEDLSEQDSELIDKIRKTYKEYYYTDEAKYLISNYPGTKEVTVKLNEQGIKQAIFTNSTAESVKRDLAKFDLSVFEIILGAGDGVVAKKPSGAGIKLIMEKMNISPKEVLYVGDTAVDILAAKDAGVDIAIVLTGMGIRYDIEKEGADYVLDDLSELVGLV